MKIGKIDLEGILNVIDNDIDMSQNKISDLKDPTVSGDADSKFYVDTQVGLVSGTLSAEIDSDIAALSGTLDTEHATDLAALSGTLTAEIDADILALSGTLDTTHAADIATVSGTLTAEIDADILALSGTLDTTHAADIAAVSGTLSAEIDSDVAALSGTLDTKFIHVDGTNDFTADQSMGGFKLTTLASPTAGTDAANKNYVDSVAQGLDVKNSVKLGTVATLASGIYSNGTAGVGAQISGVAAGNPSIDGTGITDGVRLLIKDQTLGRENGIYDVTASGNAGTPFLLTRSTDADTSGELNAGGFTFIEEGAANADQGYVVSSNNPHTMGTTTYTWTQFTGVGSITAGSGLVKSGNTLNVGTANGIVVAADTVGIDYDDTSHVEGFVNADLTAGVLTVTHSLGAKYGLVQVFDDSDKQVLPDEITDTSTSVATVDLSSFGTLAGTWHAVVHRSTTTVS